MISYKVVYWISGNIRTAVVEAHNFKEALVVFYLNNSCDDVISIEVASNVQ